MNAGQPDFRAEELLAAVVADLIGDVRHVAVGNASPIPAAAALLRARARQRAGPTSRCSAARKHTFFTDGGRELFDCAGQGRIDVFFLSGGEIDGEGNVNLVSIGDPRAPDRALSRLVRLGVSLFRRAQGDPVPHRALQAHAGAEGGLHQRAGRQRRQRLPHRRADRADHQPLPVLVRPDARRFRLESVHPGHTLAEVIVNTGFEFDRPPDVPVTPAPSAETLRLLREVVAPELAEVYPQFAARGVRLSRRL